MDIESINVKSSIGVIGTIITTGESRRGILIPTLHKMQSENGYLPEDLLRLLSKKLSIPLAEIYSVASFYKQFHFTPRGKNIVRVCTGTACHVRGASKVVNALQDKFNISPGETTEDLKLTLETVGCVGCCGLAPVVTVNEGVVGAVGPKKLKGLIHDIEQEGEDHGKS